MIRWVKPRRPIQKAPPVVVKPTVEVKPTSARKKRKPMTEEQRRAKQQAYYQANKERIKAYKEANREHVLAVKKRYRETHKEERRAYSRAHKAENAAKARRRRARLTPEQKAIEYQRLRQYLKDHPEKKQAWSRNNYLKFTYGISHQQYQELFAEHGSCCGICKTTENIVGGKNKPMSLDYDRETKTIRGFLCKSCTSAVVFFRNKSDLLPRIHEYIVKTGRV